MIIVIATYSYTKLQLRTCTAGVHLGRRDIRTTCYILALPLGMLPSLTSFASSLPPLPYFLTCTPKPCHPLKKFLNTAQLAGHARTHARTHTHTHTHTHTQFRHTCTPVRTASQWSRSDCSTRKQRKHCQRRKPPQAHHWTHLDLVQPAVGVPAVALVGLSGGVPHHECYSG